MENRINQIKREINNIIKKESPVYCDIYYDAECEDEDGIWLYDFIIYDRAEKINQINQQIDKYAKTVCYKNHDDGDYTIECTINTKDVIL